MTGGCIYRAGPRQLMVLSQVTPQNHPPKERHGILWEEGQKCHSQPLPQYRHFSSLPINWAILAQNGKHCITQHHHIPGKPLLHKQGTRSNPSTSTEAVAWGQPQFGQGIPPGPAEAQFWPYLSSPDWGSVKALLPLKTQGADCIEALARHCPMGVKAKEVPWNTISWLER